LTPTVLRFAKVFLYDRDEAVLLLFLKEVELLLAAAVLLLVEERAALLLNLDDAPLVFMFDLPLKEVALALLATLFLP
jgi:hypothetical protein